MIEELLEAYRKSRSAPERDHATYLMTLLTDTDASQNTPKLSKREKQVLVQLSRGLSDKVIARALGISENTVRFHLKNIFKKLNVTSRLQAVTEAKARFLEAHA